MSQDAVAPGMDMFMSSAYFVIVSALFPLAIYAFLVYYLAIDVARTILNIDLNTRTIAERDRS